MKIRIGICIFLFSCFTTSQIIGQTFELYKSDTINLTDINKQKQGLWIIKGKDKKELGCFSPNQIIEKGYFLNHRKTGIWTEYYCNNNIKSKIMFAYGRPYGPAIIFYKNGLRKEEGIWAKNRWHGNYILYYENGKPKQQFNFDENGKRFGLTKYFYENGSLSIVGPHEAGKENGYFIFLNTVGQIDSMKLFENAVVISTSIKPKSDLSKELLDVYELGYEKHLKNEVNNLTVLTSKKDSELVLKEKTINFTENLLDTLHKEKNFLKKDGELQKEKNSVLNQENLFQLEKVKRQNKIIVLTIIISLIFFSLIVLVFIKFKQVGKQKSLIEQQKILIEVKNNDITDSINYAQRIQRAMLPHRRDIWLAFPNSFVLFKPKDIVSGDFYFFHKNNKTNFIATADCTGHGVPGAFMSMIGAGKLNDAVSQSSDTSEILKLLNIGIKTALKQTDNEKSTRDGMDIALCSIDTENRIVKYAGANRPLWIIRKGQTEVEEIKATKTAIGGLTEDNQHFDTHEIKLQQGDTFYICTDGYADQFSGHNGKKLMTKKFKEILLNIQDKSMKEQEQYLDNFIENWKAGTEQVDDILVIGIRL